jgi:hypothetical protein
MTKKVLMHVAPDGTTKIEAQGYEGGSCLAATEPFENLFGGVVKAREMVGECAPGTDNGERVF